MVFVYFWVKIKKTTWGQPEPFRLKEVWSTFKAGLLSLLAPVIILGALITGKATPTDVGALAAAYTLFFGVYYKELKWRAVRPCLIESMTTTALIMYMVAVSTVMGWILTSERIPHEAAQVITSYIKSPFWGLMVINGFLLIVGMLMETLPSLLIMSPILYPVVKMYGVDPVHFGLIITFNLGIGIITPPVGVGLFVAAKVANVTPERISLAVLPFYVPLLISLIIITYWPQLTLWLPNLVLGLK
jgi:tripartite ATP-independent transporter DctM subunit